MKTAALLVRASGALLLAMGAMLLLTNLASGELASPRDPLFQISLRMLFWASGGIMVVAGLICLLSEAPARHGAWIIWISINFWIYKFGLIWMGTRRFEVVLGTLPETFGMPAALGNLLAHIAFGFLLAGGVVILSTDWFLQRQVQMATIKPDIKISCTHCGQHIAYTAERAGDRIVCPRCSGVIVLPAAGGFTLIEVLVVIAMIGILCALLLPSLAAAKRKAQGIQCLGNLKQLQLAWQVYADDHAGKFAPNTSNEAAGKTPDYPSWVAGFLSRGTSPDNIDTDMLVGSEYLKFGSIGGYSKNPAIYHCPADKSRDKKTRLSRVRSVSMNGWINPGVSGRTSGGYWGEPFEKYRQASDFLLLSPSDAFVFLDEREDSINDGWLKLDTAGYSPLNPSAWKITDLPAIYHNNATTFSFADGHAEFHRWLDGRTMQLKYSGGSQSTPENRDILWLMEHATRPQQ